MIYPFAELLVAILKIYFVLVIVWTIITTLISFRIINAYQPLVQKVSYALTKLCDPVMRPIRKVMPDLGGVDISPIIVILFIQFLQNIILKYIHF